MAKLCFNNQPRAYCFYFWTWFWWHLLKNSAFNDTWKEQLTDLFRSSPSYQKQNEIILTFFLVSVIIRTILLRRVNSRTWIIEIFLHLQVYRLKKDFKKKTVRIHSLNTVKVDQTVWFHSTNTKLVRWYQDSEIKSKMSEKIITTKVGKV